MFQKIIAAVTAFLIPVPQMIFTPNVIRIDFDSVVDEIRPVHNIGRMPEYELDSEINSLFTKANMTIVQNLRCKLYRHLQDFSKDINEWGII